MVSNVCNSSTLTLNYIYKMRNFITTLLIVFCFNSQSQTLDKLMGQDTNNNLMWAYPSDIFTIQALASNPSRTLSLDWGNSNCSFFTGNDNFRELKFHIGNGWANNTNLNVSNNTAFFGNECSSEMEGYQAGALVINNGFCSLQQTKPGYGTTILDFELPQTNTNIKIPALDYGTYRIAMREDFNKCYTVSSLPNPTGSDSRFAIVTDATAPTYLGTLTGGGAVVCPVFWNGSIWVSH